MAKMVDRIKTRTLAQMKQDRKAEKQKPLMNAILDRVEAKMKAARKTSVKEEIVMQSFTQFLSENVLDKPTPSVEEIAKKHDCTVEYIEQQLKAGIKIEHEHTTDDQVAREIALDHLNEKPDYYVKLKKVEEGVLSEVSNKTLSSYKKKAKHELKQVAGGSNWRKYFDRKYFRGQDLESSRKKGIGTAEKKLRGRYQPWNDLREDQKPVAKKIDRNDPEVRHAWEHDNPLGLDWGQFSAQYKKAEPKKKLHEDAAVNAAGSGGVAGIGVGAKGEPGFPKKSRTKMLRRLLPKKILKTVVNEDIGTGTGELRTETPVVRSKFAGHEVFQVPGEYFHKARLGKAKYAHYKHYVGQDDIGQTIRNFGNKHYGKPIILQDQSTQHMIYLRYGKGK